MEENLPFWEMEPADHLSHGAATIAVGTGNGKSVALGPQVFAKSGDIYAIYLPTCESTGTIDLTELSGDGQQRWFNPRTGEFVGSPARIARGARRSLGQPPADPKEDWVVLIERIDRRVIPPISVAAFRDGIHHWRKFRDPKRVID